MADDLVSKCLTLSIKDDENDIVDLGGVVCAETDEKLALLLVGKLLTERPYNFEAFKGMIMKVWAPSNGIVIRNIGQIYSFSNSSIGGIRREC